MSAKNVQYYNKDRYNVIDGVSTDFQSDSGVGYSQQIDTADQPKVVSIDSKDSEERFCSLRSLSSASDPAKTEEHKTKSLSPRNSSLSPRSSTLDIESQARTKVDILKCPKCDKEYTSDEHADLLEHIEICCE